MWLRRLFPPRSFAIRQHAASRVLDGAHLLTLLQQASGASNFGKAVAESNVKLEKERESLRGVRTDVAQRGQTHQPRGGTGLAVHLCTYGLRRPLTYAQRPSEPTQGSRGTPPRRHPKRQMHCL